MRKKIYCRQALERSLKENKIKTKIRVTVTGKKNRAYYASEKIFLWSEHWRSGSKFYSLQGT